VHPDLHRPWEDLAARFREAVASETTAGDSIGATFGLGRLEEGRRVGDFFIRRFDKPARILDLGSGNGGVSLGLANYRRHRVDALDIVPNPVLRRLRRDADIPLTQVVGSAHAIPFRSETFDAVACLETLEHIPDPPALGREVMRVLKPGGLCMIMTPARVKFLLQPDPHFGIRGLLLLPDRWQRHLVQNVLRRTSAYDVEHTFWTLRGIERLFPGMRHALPIFNQSRFDRPLWRTFRRLLWDRVVIVK
jgi:ubiquinone/menaquinone biosynthesis C-methylase UbiE